MQQQHPLVAGERERERERERARTSEREKSDDRLLGDASTPISTATSPSRAELSSPVFLSRYISIYVYYLCMYVYVCV